MMGLIGIMFQPNYWHRNTVTKKTQTTNFGDEITVARSQKCK